ncbi:MAG: DUF167 domain-containing protein [Candidatus Omnitrophica bacterium]|nr:DUF167 domain-containing protein [Candidatus Omnitrophota bacterium]
MKIFVRAKIQAKEERVEREDETHFQVYVKSPAREGKANQRIIELLSEYFSLPKSRLKIISGFKSRNKLIEIL